ncbi:hypothetical protein HELRODRAFT_169468 [Helobdella robusta]|uniref:Mitochondrial inner membrane protein Mpv17 n=1 Tax=Helobdella robusta TaxID=6412 RepID=T1F1Z4_HELRO|nr:hypothetical protein HELRODRAFT_169468 [Helobdella robusta]ESO08594.1 hypothetical protein HELRODRAFT_169468 [Helobdella robusta]
MGICRYALLYSVLMSTGDAICQIVIEKRRSINEYDFKRTSRFFTFGTLIMGPALRYWFVFLDRTFTRPPPLGVIQKLAADQDYFLILFNGYKVWPLAQLINFYIIPLQHRILFVNMVALFWNVYLAFKSFH